MIHAILSALMTLTPLATGEQHTAAMVVSQCANPNSSARADAPYFEMPAIAAEQGISGTSVVKIRLTADGRLTDDTLYTSSGNRWLDDAALRSARMTQFSPEIRDCVAVAGTYLFEVAY